jgi:hypothetical protein
MRSRPSDEHHENNAMEGRPQQALIGDDTLLGGLVRMGEEESQTRFL